MQTETLTYSVINDSVASTAAVIVAGGSSQRMNGINKLLYPILGIPVIARTLMAYEACPSIGGIYISARECDMADIQSLCDKYCITKLKAITKGGSTRAESVANAVNMIDDGYSFLAIADGARPLITVPLIESVLEEAMRFGAAMCAIPVTDTIKVVNDCGVIVETPDRSRLWAAQTPQIFKRELYMEALKQSDGTHTDDCALVESIGAKIKVVQGSPSNIKITVPSDITIAESLIEENSK